MCKYSLALEILESLTKEELTFKSAIRPHSHEMGGKVVVTSQSRSKADGVQK